MSSKYTIETGEGYLGIHSVSGSMLSIGIETLPVDWQDGQTLYTSRDGDGVALTATQRDEQIGTGSVREQRYTGTSASGMLAVSLSVGAIEPLHVSDGDDVRVYERDGEGLLLVDADDDPRIVADGGSRFVCELCQDEHDTRADALRCCSDGFDDDLDPDRALNCVDEHGSPTVLTDGGQTARAQEGKHPDSQTHWITLYISAVGFVMTGLFLNFVVGVRHLPILLYLAGFVLIISVIVGGYFGGESDD